MCIYSQYFQQKSRGGLSIRRPRPVLPHHIAPDKAISRPGRFVGGSVDKLLNERSNVC